MVTKKLQVWLPLLFAVILVLGMFFGYKLNKGGNAQSFFKANQSTTLQEAVDLIKLRYVDKVNLDSLQRGAIRDMMNQLDPHSVYFPPVELKRANEDLAGNFDGIGVEFNVFSDTVNIIYVMPAGPSDKAGIQIGDKLLAVNDSSLIGGDMSNARIHKLIRGERGSTAKIRILRGSGQQTLNVKRGSITIPSVDAAFITEPGTGYIKLNIFSEQSYEEFMTALEDLQKQGMKKLIFDLRGNGGGLMNEAIDMADEFLSDDKLIVYTQGTNSKKVEYRCKRPGLFETGELVLLMDELSASASEVLAGALQDWDRATVIGRRSFGKGLVQEQYGLSDGSAIRLTVARYFTPLGRSIQRPYDKGKKVYMEEILDRYSNGEALNGDSAVVHRGEQYKTAAGHTLFAGGGIDPDVFVPIDTATFPQQVNKLFVNGAFNKYVYLYYLEHQALIRTFTSPADYNKRFAGRDELWDRFVRYAAASDTVNLTGLSTVQRSELQGRLLAYLGRFRWRNNGYYFVLNNEDPVVIKALEQLKK